MPSQTPAPRGAIAPDSRRSAIGTDFALALVRSSVGARGRIRKTKSRGSQDGAEQLNENQGQRERKRRAAFRAWPIHSGDAGGGDDSGNPDGRDCATNHFGAPADALGGASARDRDPVALCAPAGNVATSGVYFSI